MKTASLPAAMSPPGRIVTPRGRPPRYLILRAHPGRSRADFYNSQELGLAACLRRHGFEVGVAGVFDDDPARLDPALRIHQLEFRLRHPAIALMSNLPSLHLPDYDVVQLSDLCLPGNLQVILRAPRQTRFLLYQGHYPEPIGRARLLRVLQSRLAAAALRSRHHAVLAKNAAAAAFVARCGLGPAPVVGVGLVAENLLAPQPPPAVVTEFLDRAPFTLLYVGQLNRRRPLEWVLPHLRDPALAAARLLVVGRGSSLEKLRREGSDLVASGRLLFVSNLNQSQLGAVYRRVDALVLPTRFEIFGMVCLEAVLFKLPVIASQVAGPAAVAARFPEQVSLIASDRNPAGWRRALVEVVHRERRWNTPEPDPALVQALSWDTPGRHFIAATERLLAASSADTERKRHG